MLLVHSIIFHYIHIKWVLLKPHIWSNARHVTNLYQIVVEIRVYRTRLRVKLKTHFNPIHYPAIPIISCLYSPSPQYLQDHPINQ